MCPRFCLLQNQTGSLEDEEKEDATGAVDVVNSVDPEPVDAADNIVLRKLLVSSYSCYCNAIFGNIISLFGGLARICLISILSARPKVL